MTELKNRLIGLTFEEASKIAYDEDYFLRKVMVDGKIIYGSDDFRLDRINVYLQENIIVKADFG